MNIKFTTKIYQTIKVGIMMLSFAGLVLALMVIISEQLQNELLAKIIGG